MTGGYVVVRGLQYEVKVRGDYSLGDHLRRASLGRRYDRLVTDGMAATPRADLLRRMANVCLYEPLPADVANDMDEGELLQVALACNAALDSERKDTPEPGSGHDWADDGSRLDYGHWVSTLIATYGNTPAQWMSTEIRWLEAADANVPRLQAHQSLRWYESVAVGSGLVEKADRVIDRWQRQMTAGGMDPEILARLPTFDEWLEKDSELTAVYADDGTLLGYEVPDEWDD